MQTQANNTAPAHTGGDAAARQLADIAYIRSGDKGDICTAGVIARTPADYALVKASLSPERVRAHYGDWITRDVHCYPMDNIHAVVVVMEGALGGGATRTLRLDQTGKALGHALLRLAVVEHVAPGEAEGAAT